MLPQTKSNAKPYLLIRNANGEGDRDEATRSRGGGSSLANSLQFVRTKSWCLSYLSGEEGKEHDRARWAMQGVWVGVVVKIVRSE